MFLQLQINIRNNWITIRFHNLSCSTPRSSSASSSLSTSPSLSPITVHIITMDVSCSVNAYRVPSSPFEGHPPQLLCRAHCISELFHVQMQWVWDWSAYGGWHCITGYLFHIHIPCKFVWPGLDILSNQWHGEINPRKKWEWEKFHISSSHKMNDKRKIEKPTEKGSGSRSEGVETV